MIAFTIKFRVGMVKESYWGAFLTILVVVLSASMSLGQAFTCMENGSISLTPNSYTYNSMFQYLLMHIDGSFFLEMAHFGYQLDQSQHALLHVKVSKVGRRYLL